MPGPVIEDFLEVLVTLNPGISFTLHPVFVNEIHWRVPATRGPATIARMSLWLSGPCVYLRYHPETPGTGIVPPGTLYYYLGTALNVQLDGPRWEERMRKWLRGYGVVW